MASSSQMRFAVLHSLPPIRLGSRTAFAFQSSSVGWSLQMTATVAKSGSAFTASSSQMQFAVFHLLLLIRSEESGCIHFSIPRLSLQMTSTVAKDGTACADSSSQMQFSVFDSQMVIRLRSQAAPFFNSSSVPSSVQMIPAVAICRMVFSSRLCKCGLPFLIEVCESPLW
jgi:hypothetical protein